MTYNRSLTAKLALPNPEVYIVYYQGNKRIAACLARERDAYDLADLIDGLVDHVPLFKNLEQCLEDSDIAYEYDRVRSEPSPYPINRLLPSRHKGNK